MDNGLHKESFLVSATSGKGLSDLQSKIQDALILSTGQLEKTFRIPMNGQHLRSVHKSETSLGVQYPQIPHWTLLILILLRNILHMVYLKIILIIPGADPVFLMRGGSKIKKGTITLLIFFT